MRIRTVKPQFWSHPVLCRLNDATQLLAIGLLNYADDHGYFWASPSLVKSALKPFNDDSVSVQKSLMELAKVGFIDLRTHETHGDVGRIVNFQKHQRVNRPSPSSIKDYFDPSKPMNIQCVFTESSVNDVCGNKEKEKEKEGNKEKEGFDPSDRRGQQPPSQQLFNNDTPKAEKPPPKKDVLREWWLTAWKKRRDGDYVWQSRDWGAAKALGDSVTAERLGVLWYVMRLYLDDKDPALAKAGWPFYWLKDRVNKYIGEAQERFEKRQEQTHEKRSEEEAGNALDELEA